VLVERYREGAIREADFEVLLRLVGRLSDEQRGALGRAFVGLGRA
jgi:hypothetical protein